MARPEFDIVVIGGGAGGLVVAAGGAALGARVALVEKERLGGDCLWYGCVPSKALLKSARVAHEMRHADRWALAPHEPRPDVAAVMERVAAVVRGIEPNDSPERFRALGVDVVFGAGRFVDEETFDVGGRALRAKTFVVATGSRPAIPAIPGIESVRYLTNETVFALREPVRSLVVVGGGAVGCEMAQAFRRLGSEVTVVDVAPSILSAEDADVTAVVQRALAAEGVAFRLGATAVQIAPGADPRAGAVRVTLRDADGTVEMLAASHLLVATGRRPNVEALGLDAAGVHLRADGRLELADDLTTTNRRVYAVGDAAGGAQFTHVAEHHAGIVLRHAVLRMRWARPSPVVPSCVYTDPEIARVGLSERAARNSGVAHRVYRFAFDDVDRARTDGATDGFAKLVTDTRGKLLGATIVGAHAGELIAEYTLALAKRMSARDLSGVIHAYPTFAQINRRVADQRLREALTPTAKSWIRRLFGLRGRDGERIEAPNGR
jgi:pyruvate/2-oxoglutarate dehydrogenase complex dihydrolipoamide dehydrogenase (E3) component